MAKPHNARRAVAESAPPEQFRWPPRDELPTGITVRSIPILGTTWYERGVAYWLRRAGMAALFAIADGLVVVIILAFADAAGNGRMDGGFWAVIATQIVLMVAGYGWMVTGFRRARLRKQQQGHNVGRAGKKPRTPGKRARRLSRRFYVTASYVTFALVAAGLFVRPLGVVILGAVFLGAFASSGITLFVTVKALGREFGEEHEARTALESALRRLPG